MGEKKQPLDLYCSDRSMNVERLKTLVRSRPAGFYRLSAGSAGER